MTAKKLQVRPSFYVFWSIFCLLDSENILPLFLCAAVLHELGHIIVIYACGGCVQCIELSAVGAVIRQRRNLGYTADCMIALAGPASGILCAWILSIMGFPMAAGANIMLSLFNCLPILPLDGGCALYSFLCIVFHVKTDMIDRICMAISFILSFLITVFGGILLVYTARNATVLIAGLLLLSVNASLLHGTTDYGMMNWKSYCTSIEKRWKQR